MNTPRERPSFEMSPEMRARVDLAWRGFEQDPAYAIAIAQGASSLLARRGELPFAHKRGKSSEHA